MVGRVSAAAIHTRMLGNRMRAGKSASESDVGWAASAEGRRLVLTP